MMGASGGNQFSLPKFSGAEFVDVAAPTKFRARRFCLSAGRGEGDCSFVLARDRQAGTERRSFIRVASARIANKVKH